MTRPAPYPADIRAKGWRFELDLERVMQSDTWALASPDIRPWLLMLWSTAWQQTPCGSLPSDPALICARIGMPQKQFDKCKTVLLRGWWTAEDGKMYHDTIIAQVLGMVEAKKAESARKNEYRARQKAVKGELPTPNQPPDAQNTGNPAAATGTAPAESTPQAEKTPECPKMSHGTDVGQTWDSHGTPTGRTVASTGRDATGTGTGTNKHTSKEVNRHRAQSDDEKPPSPGKWAEVFLQEWGVVVDPNNIHSRKKFWPLAQTWCNAGVTVGQMRAACDKAQSECTEPIAWLPGYADRVLASMQGPPRAGQGRPGESFAQQDARAARERWEAQTGRTHPDSLQPLNHAFGNGLVIDAAAMVLATGVLQ